MATDSEIVFVVPGDALPVATRSSTHGQVREGVRLAASHGGKSVTLKARPGEDVVRLTIANGPTLVLHPESASALLGGGDGPVVVHAQHGWSGIEAAALRDGPGP